MNLIDVINQRYSCRNYSSKPVNKKTIIELLKLANQAPSANNLQNREFIMITDPIDRKFLADMNNQRHLEEAPVVVLATAKTDEETVRQYELIHWGKY